MNDPTKLREDLRAFSDRHAEESRAWRKAAAKALERAGLCEAAGQDARALLKFGDDFLMVCGQEELTKIDARFHARAGLTAERKAPLEGELDPWPG